MSTQPPSTNQQSNNSASTGSIPSTQPVATVSSSINITKPEDTPFHPSARILITQCGADFSKSLIRRAQNAAFKRRDEMVLTNHVKEAYEELRKESGNSRPAQLILFTTSIILGISVQGFITEVSRLSTDPTTVSIPFLIGYALTSVLMAILATIAIYRP